MLRINEKRFLKNLAELAQIGRLPEPEGGGLDRRPFSAAERAARDYITRQAQAVSLQVVTDGAANLSVKLSGSPAAAQTLLLGSHLDTVPNGGAYDGALGVVAALEVLRTVAEAGLILPVHLEAIAFTDEEGRFGDFFGSQAISGSHTSGSVQAFLERAAAYPDDLAAMEAGIPGGVTPESVKTARRNPAQLAGYLELHIEQGPQLEQANLPIGVVEAIVGRRTMQFQFYGHADHAGTTPLSLRADALVAAAQFIAQAPEIVRQQFAGAVVTCGNIDVKPGVYNVVPGQANAWVEFRAASDDMLDSIEQALLALAETCVALPGLRFTVQPGEILKPAAMAEPLQAAARRAADALGYGTMTLPSGAGHDAQSLVKVTPAGMIFVPSKGGQSHSPEEDTDPEHLVAGANVLLQTALIWATGETV